MRRVVKAAYLLALLKTRFSSCILKAKCALTPSGTGDPGEEVSPDGELPGLPSPPALHQSDPGGRGGHQHPAGGRETHTHTHKNARTHTHHAHSLSL